MFIVHVCMYTHMHVWFTLGGLKGGQQAREKEAERGCSHIDHGSCVLSFESPAGSWSLFSMIFRNADAGLQMSRVGGH